MRDVKTLALLIGLSILAQSPLPSGPLAMRDFRLQFDPAGTFYADRRRAGRR